MRGIIPSCDESLLIPVDIKVCQDIFCLLGAVAETGNGFLCRFFRIPIVGAVEFAFYISIESRVYSTASGTNAEIIAVPERIAFGIAAAVARFGSSAGSFGKIVSESRGSCISAKRAVFVGCAGGRDPYMLKVLAHSSLAVLAGLGAVAGSLKPGVGKRSAVS